MSKRRLAFAGKKQYGKSTCADYLEDEYGLSVLSFADRLKFNLIDIGVPVSRLFETKDFATRKLMQYYGQVMREEEPEYWLDHVVHAIHEAEEMDVHDFAVDDMRFINEADALHTMGFKLVHVTCTDDNPFGDTHISETELDYYSAFDYHISAERGDIPKLLEQVDNIMKELR